MPFQRTPIHPYVGTRIHRIYQCMKQRCYGTPNTREYKNYGGRGIKICDEWLNDELSFIRWAYDNGYSDDLTIDRIDVDGNYTPENCRWADYRTQNNNRRSNHHIEIDGESKTATEWSRISGISASAILYRLSHGWNSKDAVFAPLMSFSDASTKGRRMVRKKGLKEDYLLEYLRTHKEGINKHEALDELKIVNLPSVIFILKSRGYDIKSTKCGSYTIYQLNKEVGHG